MTKVKIISDPYKNEIRYERQSAAGEWTPVSGTNSRLLSDRLVRCVFPFNVKEIVDVILDEFGTDGGKIEIGFEGTNDEFDDLSAVCSSEDYKEAVSAVKCGRSLKNARDIFQEVKSKFSEVERLIYNDSEHDESILRERRQFADVSKEVIPICVLGNYSCGKSTFINALIGYEILPSGDKPLTAKIHKIMSSDYADRAHIRFTFDSEDIEISFMGSEPPIIPETMGVLSEKIRGEMEKLKEYSPILCVNKTLGVLNRAADEKVGDVIEIEVPFNDRGDFGRSQHKFVIFDTPGSNTASNDKHFAVLKQAMEDLSNGLPIYVSECNDLDTKDNEQLCRLIKDMNELDSRFTMIVVNKADEANYEDYSEEAVLDQVVPRKLYSGGLYYVSSIMGLGAKTDGKFIDRHYGRIFNTLKSMFDDPENEYYEQLFRYDICPKQIKEKAVRQSEQYGDLILANSGLYWIEKEIENFAGKYSPYNKCRQALMYLHNVMEKTGQRIDETKGLYERERLNFEGQLEEGKKQLLDDMEQRSDELSSMSFDNFQEAMQPVMDESAVYLDKEQLNALRDEIYGIMESESDFSHQREMLNASGKALIGGIRDTITNIFNPREYNTMKKSLIDNTMEVLSYNHELSRIKNENDVKTSEKVFGMIKDKFNDVMRAAQTALNNNSISYWGERSVELRHELIKIVTGAALDDDKKNALADIISKYEPISFDRHADEIFVLEDFKPAFKILGIRLFENSSLNLSKLQKSYNKQIKQGIIELYDRISMAHIEVFSAWVKELLMKIKVSITDFNPDLHDLVKSIDNKNHLIRELEYRQDRLRKISGEIAELMSWQGE